MRNENQETPLADVILLFKNLTLLIITFTIKLNNTPPTPLKRGARSANKYISIIGIIQLILKVTISSFLFPS